MLLWPDVPLIGLCHPSWQQRLLRPLWDRIRPAGPLYLLSVGLGWGLGLLEEGDDVEEVGICGGNKHFLHFSQQIEVGSVAYGAFLLS